MGGGADHGHGHGHGEAHGDFRTKVWSMSGGPYCRPKHWRRNTAIAMAGQRPHHPVRPIPSQIWCKNFGNKDY
ncbi:hypothetical protein CFP56_041422 [Quercus suber]|uniref:Uncharacterized protein n=1 Tax=Quercus suber TaxID=58331 RepID=A0AAW0IVC2_QUESU